jgi:hypothetical protein
MMPRDQHNDEYISTQSVGRVVTRDARIGQTLSPDCLAQLPAGGFAG